MALITYRVARVELLEAHGCADITRLHELDRVLVVGVHLIQACYPFLFASTCIKYVGTGIQTARIRPHESEAAHEGIRCNLEYECAEGLLCGRFAFKFRSGAGVRSSN